MRTTLKPVVLLLAWGQAALGQNLVPNPGFEEYIECPSTYSQFARVVAWESIQGSPDLFNACCASDSAGVPLNFMGYQAPFEGSGYAGVATAEIFSKEYMQAELISPLVPGMATYISMRISPGGFGVVGTTSPQLASSGIGLRFSVQRLDYFTTFGQFDYDTAVVSMSEVLNDTSAWHHLRGTFIPDSAYRYVQIGNFFSDDRTTVEVLDPLGDWGCAYAFIDAVCVSQNEDVCDVLNEISTLADAHAPPQISLTAGVLSIHVPQGQAPLSNVKLIDPIGRVHAIVYKVDSGSTSHLPFAYKGAGIYLLTYQNPDGRTRVVRFVHVQP